MIIYLILSIAIFISIFYLHIYVVFSLLIIFFIIYTILTASIRKSIKRIVYIMPYFISVLILQSMVVGGEVYNIAGFSFHKNGIDTTIEYFIRIIAILYYIGIVFILSKNIKMPKNKFTIELIRITIFFNIMKRNFFRYVAKVRDKRISFREKIILIKSIIHNVYIDTFKHYPYDRYVNYYYRNRD